MENQSKKGYKLRKAGDLTAFLSAIVSGIGCIVAGVVSFSLPALIWPILIPSIVVMIAGLMTGFILKEKSKKYYPKKDTRLLEEIFENTENKTKQQQNIVMNENLMSKNKEDDQELTM